ncbi:response regulator transcription factor [Nocardia sp. CA-119907]|uniref:helix-turn-helix transcriptional regulator n=1 Tax=Nocardia sp. CA-119907 TaxID=3239973 RepID=UPI003D984268
MRALVMLAWTCVLQGDMQSAIARLEELLTISESHGETAYRSIALRPMALAVWQQGERQRAEQLLEESLRSARQVVNPIVAAIGLEILAWIAAEKHDARRAAVLLGASHELLQAGGGSGIVQSPHLLAYHVECEQHTRDALSSREYESAYREGSAMSFEAAVDFALGERDEAVASTDREAASLTKRERQVVDLIAEGLTNKAIAARLVISQRTAQGHVEHILTKLGFTSRSQIAAWVAEHGRGM